MACATSGRTTCPDPSETRPLPALPELELPALPRRRAAVRRGGSASTLSARSTRGDLLPRLPSHRPRHGEGRRQPTVASAMSNRRRKRVRVRRAARVTGSGSWFSSCRPPLDAGHLHRGGDVGGIARAVGSRAVPGRRVAKHESQGSGMSSGRRARWIQLAGNPRRVPGPSRDRSSRQADPPPRGNGARLRRLPVAGGAGGGVSGGAPHSPAKPGAPAVPRGRCSRIGRTAASAATPATRLVSRRRPGIAHAEMREGRFCGRCHDGGTSLPSKELPARGVTSMRADRYPYVGLVAWLLLGAAPAGGQTTPQGKQRADILRELGLEKKPLPPPAPPPADAVPESGREPTPAPAAPGGARKSGRRRGRTRRPGAGWTVVPAGGAPALRRRLQALSHGGRPGGGLPVLALGRRRSRSPGHRWFRFPYERPRRACCSPRPPERHRMGVARSGRRRAPHTNACSPGSVPAPGSTAAVRPPPAATTTGPETIATPRMPSPRRPPAREPAPPSPVAESAAKPEAAPPPPEQPPLPVVSTPTATSFATTVHPVLMAACAACHRAGAPAAATRLVLSGDAARDEDRANTAHPRSARRKPAPAQGRRRDARRRPGAAAGRRAARDPRRLGPRVVESPAGDSRRAHRGVRVRPRGSRRRRGAVASSSLRALRTAAAPGLHAERTFQPRLRAASILR